MDRWLNKIILGVSEDVLKEMPDNSISSIVTDPPYGIKFMGKKWDYSVPSVALWEEAYRVLKPGAHVLSFGGTRTYHRMVVNIEDAGFEIRDQILWLYGCLSEDTELLVNGKWEPYHKATEGNLALCYNIDNDSYSWEPIQELLIYEYDDTAYSIRSERTDQIVSRNHRCIINSGDGWGFSYAEESARKYEVCVPVVENLSGLLEILPSVQPLSGSTEQDMFQRLRECPGKRTKTADTETDGTEIGPGSDVCSLRNSGLETECLAQEGEGSHMFLSMQRDTEGQGLGGTRSQGAFCMDGRIEGKLQVEDVRCEESGVERRGNLLQETRQLQADQVCALPCSISGDGKERRLCDGAQVDSSPSNRAMPLENGSGSSRKSQSAGQPQEEPATIFQQPGSQAVRGERFTASDLARIEPLHYTGKVWCVRVPTGAFVARRNGKVFVTGNSGFPKSLNIQQAINKAARGCPQGTADPTSPNHGKFKGGCCGESPDGRGFGAGAGAFMKEKGVRRGDDSGQWQGWGTALKPAVEPICLARKPLEGTVANNVLKWGTGGMNIDECRVEGESTRRNNRAEMGYHGGNLAGEYQTGSDAGRFPANVIHDGSDEVLQHFPESNGQQGAVTGNEPSSSINNCYGQFNGRPATTPRNDNGSAARFFKQCNFTEDENEQRIKYCAKASTSERGDGNNHPTVKPLDLIKYLVKLITPPDGIVLDMFGGSGTTALACLDLGFPYIVIDKEPDHVFIANERIKQATRQERLFL